MDKAMAVVSKVDSRTNRLQLRSGAKGTGKVLWSGQYWPDSGKSVEQIYDYMAEAASRLDVEVVYPELDE